MMDLTVKLYQTKLETPYVFRPYDDAVDKFSIDDYNLVATVQLNCDESTPDITTALEELFQDGNNGKLQQATGKQFRSISVSDVFDVNGDLYYVDTFGFKKIG